MVSDVWQFCTRLAHNRVRCDQCGRIMSYHGTTNLRVHIGRHYGLTPQLCKFSRSKGSIKLPLQPGSLAPMTPKPLQPEPPPAACVRWNGYQSNIQTSFPRLLEEQRFVDVTLACDGKSMKCHQIILAACSPYFDELLAEHPCQHPIVILKGIKFWELEILVEFMYHGEINVGQEQLATLLAAAEVLKIKGLATFASPSEDTVQEFNNTSPTNNFEAANELVATPHVKRVVKRRSLQPPISGGYKPLAKPSNTSNSARKPPIRNSIAEQSSEDQENLPSSSKTLPPRSGKKVRPNKWRRVRLAIQNALEKKQGISNPAIKVEPDVESEAEPDDVEFQEDFETFEMAALNSSLDTSQTDKSVDPLSHTPPDGAPPDDYGPTA